MLTRSNAATPESYPVAAPLSDERQLCPCGIEDDACKVRFAKNLENRRKCEPQIFAGFDWRTNVVADLAFHSEIWRGLLAGQRRRYCGIGWFSISARTNWTGGDP